MGTTRQDATVTEEVVAQRLRAIPGVDPNHVAALAEAVDGVVEVMDDLEELLRDQTSRRLVRRYHRGEACYSPELKRRWLERFDELETGVQDVMMALSAFDDPLPWEVLAAVYSKGHHHLTTLLERDWLYVDVADGGKRVRCWRPWTHILRGERGEAVERARNQLLDHTVRVVDAWKMDWHRGDVTIDELESLRTLLTAAHDRAIHDSNAREAMQVHGFLCDVLWSVGPQDEELRRTEETLNLPGLEPFQTTALSANVLRGSSRVDLPAAQALVDQCDAHATESNWRGPLAQALAALATHAFRADDRVLALSATRRFLSVPGLSDVDRLHHLGVGASNLEALGHKEEAVKLLDEGRSEAARLGFPAVRYMMATSLSGLLITHGEVRSAIRLIEETLREPMPSKGSYVALLTNLGEAHLYVEQLEAGRDVLEVALAFQQKNGLQHQLGRCQIILGECLSGLGDYERAEATLAAGVRQVLSLRRLHIGMAAIGMAWQARHHARAGNVEDSRRAAESASAAIEGKEGTDLELTVRAVLLNAEWLLTGGGPALRSQVVDRVRLDHPGRNIHVRRELRLLAALEDADLELSADGATVEYEGASIDLSRFRANREIFLALARAHDTTPGSGCRIEQLVEAAWPDQNLAADSGNRRVYTAMGTLRKAGLDTAIERAPEGGYRLRPDLVLRWT